MGTNAQTCAKGVHNAFANHCGISGLQKTWVRTETGVLFFFCFVFVSHLLQLFWRMFFGLQDFTWISRGLRAKTMTEFSFWG